VMRTNVFAKCYLFWLLTGSHYCILIKKLVHASESPNSLELVVRVPGGEEQHEHEYTYIVAVFLKLF
jgi:hypothetical protein